METLESPVLAARAALSKALRALELLCQGGSTDLLAETASALESASQCIARLSLAPAAVPESAEPVPVVGPEGPEVSTTST